jgi:hypothetical protein
VGALNTPKNETVKPFTEQARTPKANGDFLQTGVVIRVGGKDALTCANFSDDMPRCST